MDHNARHTHAGRVCVDLVRFGCFKWDEFFPGIEDESVIDRGVSVLSNREKSERNCPIAP